MIGSLPGWRNRVRNRIKEVALREPQSPILLTGCLLCKMSKGKKIAKVMEKGGGRGKLSLE